MGSRKTIVLFSGGLDSTALLHLALERGRDVIALGFRYGQPHADAELHAAGVIAKRLGIPYRDAPLVELPRLNPEPGKAGEVSRAFVPGRNGLFVWRAAVEAATTWPGERVDLWLGANADDASGFPDCRPAWVLRTSASLGEGLAGFVDVFLSAPWAEMRYGKRDVVAWAAARPDALRDVRDSVSCYRGTRCGACDACALRASAFATAGLADGSEQYRMSGGDAAREAAFGGHD